MKNYIREGTTMPIVAPAGGLKSGDPVLVGSIVGVAAIDAAVGVNLEAHVEGVFTLPKTAVDALSQGDALYWDDAAGEFTSTTAGNTRAGVAFRAAAGGGATVEVKLTPGVG